MPAARSNLSIIPWPADVTLAEGLFAGDDDAITLTLDDADTTLGDEGYKLQVTPTRITIRAPNPAGLFYGSRTLQQLLARRPVPALQIVDRPRFVWRGLMLDEARHFFGKEFVKRVIDLLALHKLNVFHWHLCDDQGWRLEIRKRPRLTEVGAWRPGDGQRYGGLYTSADIREIVTYAQSRYVTVVPEIEMPGHATAALASHPELSCTGGPFDVATRWGIFEDVFCAGNDATFAFFQDVLGEVLELFPSKFIHIGGDECPKTRWRACPKCQKRIRDERLADEHELQSYFIRRVERFLNAYGRQLIGWDEILEGGLAPNAAVMSWRGMSGAVAAARAGHDVVASPTSHCYLDYSHEKIDLERAYSFDPIPAELTDEQRKHILGIQGSMWTELTPTATDVERQIWPRLCALAEVAWSPPGPRDFAGFSARLAAHGHQFLAVPHRR
jgi:hexosaminidase